MNFKLSQVIIALFLVILFSCSKTEDFNIEPPKPIEPSLDVISPSAFTDIGNVDIKTIANGNSWDSNNLSWLKDISGNKASYCHPDVEYFPNSFNGYKFWMAFTPYFGLFNGSKDAILYENPTIVASNDGLNWVEPRGLINPIQKRPSIADAIVRNGNEVLQGYWSDTDLLFTNNQLELYYRGSSISLTSLKRISKVSPNNTRKMTKPAVRTIVKQESNDGIHWNPIEIVYTSNEPETLGNNDVLSPSFIKVSDKILSYEVLLNKRIEGYEENDESFVLKRISDNGLDFTDFKQSKIVKFDSKPWKDHNANYSPWHLQATYVDGYYFLCMAIGNVKSFTSEVIYIAYSKDGENFKVYNKPIVSSNAYRSCMFPIGSDVSSIDFGAIIGLKSGKFKYRKFKVNKKRMKELLG